MVANTSRDEDSAVPGTSLMDLPNSLLHKIVMMTEDGKCLRAICRKGREAANWAVESIGVRRDESGAALGFSCMAVDAAT